MTFDCVDRLLTRCADAVFPAVCALCAGTGDADHAQLHNQTSNRKGDLTDDPLAKTGLCSRCLRDMPLPYEVNGLSAACRYCGLQIAVSGAGAAVPNPYEAVCGSCIAEPMFDACVAACSYDYPVDQLIPALKFQRRRSVAKLLGGLLACSAQVRIDAGVVSCPDLLLPVPLHPCRLYSRAYNQAVEIASCIKLNDGALPVRAGYCSRIRSTPAQSGLSGRARRSNLRGAFSVSSRVLRRGLLEGRTVAMVDDVMTTGSTLQEFASVLRAAGAREVQAWVVARVM